MWNVSTAEELVLIDNHPDMIFSMAFNALGTEMVTTCKDKKIRVFTSRNGDIISVRT
jgi:coronin-1B/1C/6